MSDQVLMNLRFERSSTKVLWTTRRHQPTFLRLSWLRVEQVIVRRLFNQVERDFLGDQFYVDQLFGLCSRELIAYQVQPVQRLDLVRQWIEQGRIIAWREAPPFTGPSGDQPVDNALLAPLYRSYAKQLGMDPGTVVAPPAAGEGHKPVIPAAAAVPAASAGQALDNKVSEYCPSHNHRSESHRTATPAVMEWLRKKAEVLIPEKQDMILGAASGGGFLVSTTRVSTLPEGTPLFRYYDVAGNAGNYGGWWTTQLVVGDPRQTLALPPSEPNWSNSAKSVCHAQLGKGITALTGLGAPRCSNKPGGPQQWFIAWQDREAGVLRLPNDISKYLPKEP